MATNVLRRPVAKRKATKRGPAPRARNARRSTANTRVRAPQGAVRLQPLSKQARQNLEAFVLALLVTGLVFGGLLAVMFLPLDLSTLLPQSSSPATESAYVMRVLQNYARSQDLAQAQHDLANLDPQQLAGTLTALEQNTTDPQTRRELAALSSGLHVQTPQPSFLDTLMGQPVFVVGLVFSALPLLAVLGLVAGPALLKRLKSGAKEAVAEPSSTHEADASLGVPPPTTDLSEAVPELNGPGSQAAAPEPAPADNKETVLGKEEEEKASENVLGDLASLFEDEETSNSALESLVRGLSDLEVTELSSNTATALHSLKDANSGAAKPVQPGGSGA